ncbi:hypothetical protein SMICM304S_01169 [Streptomyces microflavus]
MTYGTPAGHPVAVPEETTHNPLMSGASSRALAWIAAGLQATPRFQ